MLTVVVLAIALASLGSAYFGGMRARHAQDESLRRVTATLTEGGFPLNEWVLRQMSGLSGAEFILLNQRSAVEAATLHLDEDDLQQVRSIQNAPSEQHHAARARVLLDDRVYLAQRVSVTSRGTASPAGSLVVLYPEDRWSAAMYQAAYPALAAGALATIAVVLVTTFLAHRFVQPIRQLRNKAAAIAHGDFQPLTVPQCDDEIGDLAISINQMSEQLGHYESQVRRHEQLRTLDRLGAGMAHQLRNAATGGRIAIELHQRECTAGPANESLDVALRQLRLMESYLQRFMALGRDHTQADKKVCWSTVVEDALSLVRPACAHAGIELQFTPPQQPIHVMGDSEALQQLTVNLVVNAMEAAGQLRNGKPQIVVSIERTGAGQAALHVSDNGPGPSSEVAAQLFEPFVSGKREGTGLGLYVARQIAEAHHGTIRWQRQNETTRFTVELPVLTEN